MSSTQNPCHLRADLEAELRTLRNDFTVTGDKLKEISKRFEDELKEGLERENQNIVRRILRY
jgi:hexokinase